MQALLRSIAIILLFGGTSYLLFWSGIEDFTSIIAGYTIAFTGYWYLLRREKWFTALICIGIALRVFAIFAFPLLSDDIYRFIWDGILINEGVNPFSSLPAEIDIDGDGFKHFLLTRMNSPTYFSVYPTILQGIFAFVTNVIPAGIYWQSVLMKSILFVFEMSTLYVGTRLLNKLQLPKSRIFIYFLNPLVIVELMGNMHMELIMISFFIGFLYLWKIKKYGLAAIILSLSIGSKLLTLLVSPFLIKRLRWIDFMKFSMVLGLCILVLFTPMFYMTYENFGKGLDLYFQKFEFNASIYYLIREIGYWYKGYNIIGILGPSLAVLSTASILFLAWREKEKDIASMTWYLTIALTCYFFLSTTVHPWYTTLLVALSIFSGLRYPILWSYLAVLSYAKYYAEEFYYIPLVAIEYGLLWMYIIYEWKANKATEKEALFF